MHLSRDDDLPIPVRILAYIKGEDGLNYRSMTIECSEQDFEILVKEYNMVVQILADKSKDGEFVLVGMSFKMPGAELSDMSPEARKFMEEKIPDGYAMIIYRAIDTSVTRLALTETNDLKQEALNAKEREFGN